MSVNNEKLTTERVLGNIEAAVEIISHQVPLLTKKLEDFQLKQTELNAASMQKYTYVLERLSLIEDVLTELKTLGSTQGYSLESCDRDIEDVCTRIDLLEGRQVQKVEKKKENKKLFKRGCINVFLYVIKIILAAALAGFGLGVIR